MEIDTRAGLDARQRNTALLVAGCFFMEMLDGTIVTTAAPALGASLGVAPTAVGLVITAYLLTLAVFIPLSGWLTARFGPRRVFLTAIALFTLASVGCAASTNLTELVALRVLQGLGGALMVPVGRLVVLARTAKPDIPRVISYIVWPGLLAPVVAPVLGGVITTYWSWHWLFLINIPLGALAFAVAWRLVRDDRAGAAVPPLDWAGVALTCLGLGGLTYAAHLVSESVGGWPAVAATGAGSLALLGLAARHLLRTEHPLLDLRALRVATLRASVVGGSLYWIVVGAVPFLLTLMFQDAFGWSPVRSGAVVLFVFVGNIAIKPATTYLLNRFGLRALLIGSTAAMTATVAGCGFLTGATPLAVIAAVVLASGVARSVGLTGYTTIAFADIPPAHMRQANTLSATATQVATGLGVAAATVALRIGELVPGDAYRVAFLLLSLVTVAAMVGALRLGRTAGDAVRTR
ncbi:MFS transporter [Pseudonocardia eucalypti]|uniref:MFS transporter n=1 Tax=Pseudonocardia eucalypti TaxID=648755 RepID=A0ABP9R1Q7_9PSEU|nr:EmrB/QacA subfamily drug resistance transporter [Pseudonocardia eucalypti]